MNWQAQVQAEREACLFHLYGALLGLCHEIAGYYRLPQADASAVEQLLSAERLAASPSPEMAELVELDAAYRDLAGQVAECLSRVVSATA